MLSAIGMKLLGWVFGGGLTSIGQIGVDFYRTKLTAENTTEKHVADLAARALELDAKERELDTRLLVAEQGNWMTRWVRPAWALPFVAYTWKAVLYDKVLGWGSTDAIHGDLATLMMVVAGAYFGGRSVEKVAGILASWKTAKEK